MKKKFQENLRNCRKSLKVLQKTATDKENLIGRTPAFIGKEQLAKKTPIISDALSTPDNKRIKASTSSQSCQTTPSLEGKTITEEDLTTEEVGEHYWEILAEKRRVALEESLIENEELYERIGTLESELNEKDKVLQESKNLVEVLTEMLGESKSADSSMIDQSFTEENHQTHKIIETENSDESDQEN